MGTQDDRLYFIRPAATVGTQDLWTIAIDGTGERRVADLGAFRPIDVFFDVSRHGLVAGRRFAPETISSGRRRSSEALGGIHLRSRASRCCQQGEPSFGLF